MSKSKEIVEISGEESELVSQLRVHPHRPNIDHSFYEDYALRGIRVDRVQPGFVSCSFKVPSRLTDRRGILCNGAIANLVDEVGAVLVHVDGLPMSVSVDMSICFLSTAKVNHGYSKEKTLDVRLENLLRKLATEDELEITSRFLGQKGRYSGTIVLLKNKLTGELIAEGRHSLFGQHRSKI